MLSTVANISALLVSIAILVAGNGLQNSLIAVRANLEALPTLVIGVMVTGYYVGFMAGAVVGPRIIMRAGHIRAFAAFAAIATAAALTHALIVQPVTWMALRVVSGICFAGLYMVIESWLNERTPNETRGKILSLYRIIELSAMTSGQLLLTTTDPAGFTLFSFVSILICLALVPMALTKASVPPPIQTPKVRLGKLFRISPLGVVGCFVVGVANGAFWGLAPLSIRIAGLSVDVVGYFMSACIIGGVLFQWPLGMLSDRMDRRTVLVANCVLATVAGVVMSFAGSFPLVVLLAAGLIYGGLTLPIYMFCVAHTNDNAGPGDFVEASSGLILVYSIGAVVGPTTASVVMDHLGGWALFGFTAMVIGGLAAFGIVRMLWRAPVPLDEQAEFLAVPPTTPAVYELDPRADAEDPESDLFDDDPARPA